MWRETSITHSPTDDYMTILYPFAPEPQVHMVYKQTREGAGAQQQQILYANGCKYKSRYSRNDLSQRTYYS